MATPYKVPSYEDFLKSLGDFKESLPTGDSSPITPAVSTQPSPVKQDSPRVVAAKNNPKSFGVFHKALVDEGWIKGFADLAQTGLYTAVGGIKSIAPAIKAVQNKQPVFPIVKEQVKKAIENQSSFSDIVDVAFPRAKPSPSWWENMSNEIVRSAYGLSGDILLDPVT